MAGLIQIGNAGVQAGLQQAQRAATDIAGLGAESAQGGGDPVTSLAEAAVDLLTAENQVKASARVIETADELLGTIIDILA